MTTKRSYDVAYHMPGQPPRSSSSRVQAESESDAQHVFRRTHDARAVIDLVRPG